MEKFIKVSTKEDSPHEDVPLNDDGALSLTILRKYYPRAVGLKYFSEAEISHEIDLDDERFYPPLGLWGDLTYYCICSEDSSEFIEVKSEPLCIEDIRCSESEDRSDSLNMVHIKISSTTKSRKKTYKPKGKYKKRKPHQCDICGKHFRNQSYVETHKLIHTGEKPHACSHCEERFVRQDLLRIHTKTVHNISCRRVKTPVQRSPGTKRDKRKMDDLYYFAEVKKRKYTRRKSKSDNADEEEQEVKSYQCVNCSVSFPTKTSLRKHPCTNNQTLFTCEECRQTFTKLSKLRLHLYKCHADQKIVKKASPPAPKIDSIKSLSTSKPKNKCKYAKVDVKQDLSDVESSDDDVSYWDCLGDSENISYVSKCDCVPNFNIVHYIEAKIPPEILTKFRYCKLNNIPWTGFLGYSALYKFWARIVNDNPYHAVYVDNPADVQVMDPEDGGEDDQSFNETVTEYIITEDDVEVSEATTENTNFLKGVDDLIKSD